MSIMSEPEPKYLVLQDGQDFIVDVAVDVAAPAA